MLKKITFEIETITPMFISGADQNRAELRAASIKGLLRFWWRAMQAEPNIERLREREGQIFGSSDEGVGGSSFAIRTTIINEVKPTKIPFPKHNITVTSKGKPFSVNILEYLAYGTLEYIKNKGNVFIRDYIPPTTKFNLTFSFNNEKYYNEVIDTMYVFSLFGGIGSRSRNGFGSFYVINAQEVFSNLNNLSFDRFIKKEIEPLPYASFTGDTRLFRTKNIYNSWDAALAEIGKIYRGIRSSDIKYDGKPFESKHYYDKRQYIGAPLIVDKKEKSFLDRHAKPYFIKIAKEAEKYRAYILYLPSQYCTGLQKDKSGNEINHQKENKRFTQVCAEFNNFLSQQMETVV